MLIGSNFLVLAFAVFSMECMMSYGVCPEGYISPVGECWSQHAEPTVIIAEVSRFNSWQVYMPVV